MRELSIDIETYSSVDIKSAGAYKYVQSNDFEILLFAYAFDNDPVKIIDLTREQLPSELVAALSNKDIIKTAYNAMFEWYALNKFYNSPLSQWKCTMAKGLYAGYPAGLDAIGKALGLNADKKKLAAGKALIRYFCMPCNPTKSNGGRTRNLPHHEPEKWELFKEYCIRDVVAEREIKDKLNWVMFPESEQQLWEIDTALNARGVHIDKELVEGAINLHDSVVEELMLKAKEITNLDNPNSVSQLKTWISTEINTELNSLSKSDIPELLENCSSDKVKEVLEIRQELGKTSVKKFQAMDNALCSDGRVRGLLQYYGANRTGRWAGRLVQVQNLPRNYMQELDVARKLVKSKNLAMVRALWGNVPDTISQLVRTAFIPKPGYKFIVADYSAIEARVISWLAEEEWRLNVFETHGKIYEACASQMFHVPIDKITKGNPEYELRQKGKVAELALGYQGGTGALIKMGALNMGLKEAELPDIVNRWRNSNRKIVKLWTVVEGYATTRLKCDMNLYLQKNIYFKKENGSLVIKLPSGRSLYYVDAKLTPGEYKEQVTYKGLNQTTKKWEDTATYGGKLVENIVQAIARDCLACAIKNLVAEGYYPVMHIHDEVICEVPDTNEYTIDKAIEIMCRPVEWAKGLPLNADGFESYYYKKE